MFHAIKCEKSIVYIYGFAYMNKSENLSLELMI